MGHKLQGMPPIYLCQRKFTMNSIKQVHNGNTYVYEVLVINLTVHIRNVINESVKFFEIEYSIKNVK